MDIIGVLFATAAALACGWVFWISRRDIINKPVQIAMISLIVFTLGKLLDVQNLFGTEATAEMFSDVLEIVLVAGIVALISIFYLNWRREDWNQLVCNRMRFIPLGHSFLLFRPSYLTQMALDVII